MWLGVKHRENLRFARTKIWGVTRNLFRAVGLNLYKLGMIKAEEVHICNLLLCPYYSCCICLVKDVFYLTVDELFTYVEGRSVTNDLMALTDLRKKEWSGYKKVNHYNGTACVHMCVIINIQGLQPPERFMTNGAVGPYLLFPQLLDDLDLLREVEV